jgi:hypothetical protein
MTGDVPRYWSYWHRAGGQWEYATRGAANSFVQNGAVEGWVWGVGPNGGGAPPPAVEFGAVCGAATATSTATATPTGSPTASPTATATGTASATPTQPPTATTVPPTPWIAPANTPPAPTISAATPTAAIFIAPPRIALFAAEPPRVVLGARVLLRWQVVDSVDVRLRQAQGDIGVPPVGELWVQPRAMMEYTLLAQSAGGQIAQALRVEVAPAPILQPASQPPPAMAVSLASPHTVMLPIVQKSLVEPATSSGWVLEVPALETPAPAVALGAPTRAIMPVAAAVPVVRAIPPTVAPSALPAVALTPLARAGPPSTVRQPFAESTLPGNGAIAQRELATLAVLGAVVFFPLGLAAMIALAFLTYLLGR